jgi:hypothetical protein
MMTMYKKQTEREDNKTTENMSQQQATTNMQSETHEKSIDGTWSPYMDCLVEESKFMTAKELYQYTIVFNDHADKVLYDTFYRPDHMRARRLSVFEEICCARNNGVTFY